MPAPSKTFTATERPDLEKLRIIHDNWDVISIRENICSEWTINGKTFNQLALYKKYMNKNIDGDVKVEYFQSKKAQTHGRQYAADALSIQSFSRTVRHTICRDYYADIDMVNCHPTILRQYAEKSGYSNDKICNYIDNRDALLAELMALNNITKDAAKTIILSLMNGGNAAFNALAHKPAWLLEFTAQVTTIQRLELQDPKNAALVKQVKRDKSFNLEGSVLNHVLCDIEDSLLRAALNYIESLGLSIQVSTLAFDGFMIPKGLVGRDDKFFEGLGKHVFQKTGYLMKFIEKPMDEFIDLTGFNAKPMGHKTYEELKVEFEKDHAKLMEPYCFIQHTENFVLNKEADLKGKYKNLFYARPGSDTLMPFINKWLEDPNIRTYDRVVYCPPGCKVGAKDTEFNKWKPYKWADCELPVEPGMTDSFNKHLLIMCGNDEAIYKYNRSWLASIIQNPGKKTGKMLCIVGSEGIGKSMIMELLERLVGREKFMTTNSPERDIISRFSYLWTDKVIVCMNDFNTMDTRGSDKKDKYKAPITDDEVVIELKGGLSYETKNYANFISTTNSYNPVAMESGSRRYFVFESSSMMMGNAQYFKDLSKDIADDAKVNAWFQELNNDDLSDFNVNVFPNTEISDLIKKENASPIERFMEMRRDEINKLVVYKHDKDGAFTKCDKRAEDAIACLPQKELTKLFEDWAGVHLTDVNPKQYSRKLQLELMRIRNHWSLEWKANKKNSYLSVWTLKDPNVFGEKALE